MPLAEKAYESVGLGAIRWPLNVTNGAEHCIIRAYSSPKAASHMSSHLQPRTLSETEKLAAQMLAKPNLVATLTLAEAMVIVDMMRPKRIPTGTIFITEGEDKHNDYMLLLLEGDAVIETKTAQQKESIVIGALGPGSIFGEMSVLDGSPRATSCRATSDISAAILTRARLQELLAAQPLIAAKLIIMLHGLASERVRDGLSKMNVFMQINDVLREQLNAVMNSRTLP